MSRVTTTSSRLIAGTIAALVLAACSTVNDSSTGSLTPTEPSLSQAPELNTPRHLFHTKEFYARPGGGGGGRGTGIYYHGGTVITSPATKVVAIYWGNPNYANLPSAGTGSGSQDGTLIGTFLRGLGGSAYFGINTSYYNASNVAVQNSVTYTGYWHTGAGDPAPSSAPTDADMINLIRYGIANNKIAYDGTTVYAILTASGVNLGGGFGSSYCAYHTHGSTAGGQTFYYAAMPYNQQYPSGCTSGLASPNTDVAANSEVNTLAHEIEETTTDAMGNAWFDNRGYENADKCAWTWGTVQTDANGKKYNMVFGTTKFLVQQNWVNLGSGGCALSLPSA
jgi:phosphate-induced protein 1